MIIWVKTPRCAGTSILRHCTTRKIIPDKMRCILPHYKFDFMTKEKALWESSYKIAVVRNPFDRLISAWRYLQEKGYFESGVTLKNLLLNMPDNINYPNAWLHLTRSQADLIQDVDGCITYDKILRFETLQEDLNDVFINNDIEPFTLYQSNESDRQPGYRQYYDAETRAMVERKYWIDLKLFGYEF